MAIYLSDLLPKTPPVAMTIPALPGWRVMVKKPSKRQRTPKDMPNEFLYKLVVIQIKYWGIRIPVFSQKLRTVPVNPDKIPVSGKSESGYSPADPTSWVIASHQLSEDDVLRLFPLGRGKREFENVVDILTPDETDAQALIRVEAHYEADRAVLRLKNIQHVMES